MNRQLYGHRKGSFMYMLKAYPLDTLRDIIASSNSRKDCFEKLCLPPSGFGITRFEEYCSEVGIVTDHLKCDHIAVLNANQGKPPRIPTSEILVKGRQVGSSKLKGYLLDIGRAYECVECNLKDTWNDKYIRLHVDHINGIKDDNRPENLRFLCPNCHSQTDTYCGRNIGRASAQ